MRWGISSYRPGAVLPLLLLVTLLATVCPQAFSAEPFLIGVSAP